MRFATRALRTLRPLIGASCPADIDKVVREFAAELDAMHYVLGIVQHTPGGDVLRWLCEDAWRWWEAFRPEFSPLVAAAGWRAGQLRITWRTLDDDQFFPVHDELQRLRARSGLFLVADGLRPGDTLACLGLLFGFADSTGGAMPMRNWPTCATMPRRCCSTPICGCRARNASRNACRPGFPRANRNACAGHRWARPAAKPPRSWA